ncbi:TPR repeat region-containing protein [Mycolicibacterium senegalense]|uniref:TPR repeat region-containing protein n=1 Tax=Mycolicibacterium senegalense TaxID=1796 RepID=UPI003639215C
MSALDGFYSTWNKARETFGVGTPTDGSQHDGSSQLLRMKGMIDSAAKHDGWQGTGADAYAAANKEHASVYSKLAELDKQMAAEVTNAANIVTTGRAQLDNTKSWVDSAVNVVPTSLSAADREKYFIPIAKEGITQVNNTVSTANGQMLQIGFRVTDIKKQYEELTNQKFGPGEKKGEEAHALPPEEQAEKDVEATLNGKGADGPADRVDEVLSSIKPGEPLTPLQDAYLSKMQQHQKGMSVEELTTAEQRLGDNKNVIADSWQLMSNKDVEFSGAGQDKHGSAAQLPDSVQDALKNAAFTSTDEYESPTLANAGKLEAIADIVKDGNPEFQKGTELDRQIIKAADEIMDTRDSIFGSPNNLESTTQSLFEAVDDDHQIINDHLMGRNGMDAKDFLHDVNTINWEDNGKAAGYLFGWTGEAGDGPEAQIAAQTADKYAEYLGENRPKMMDINGQTLGQLNPELVRQYAHGLVPFVDEMGGIGNTELFEIDGGDSRRDGLMPNAKGVFAVLNTDSAAATTINQAAFTEAIKHETAYTLHPNDPAAQSHMYAAATMRGLVDVGAHEAFQAFEKNHFDAGVDENKWKKSGFDAAVAAVSTGSTLIPEVGFVAGPTVSQIGAVFGQELFDNSPPPIERPLPQMSSTHAGETILDAMLAAGNPLSFPADQGWIDHTDPAHPHVVKPPGVDDDVYAAAINAQIGEHTAALNSKGPNDFYAERYNNVIQDPDIQDTPSREKWKR